MKLFSRPFVSYRLQGAGKSPGPEDPFDGACLEGLISDGVLNCPVDILTLVVFLHPQDVSSVESAVSGMPFRESLEKHLGHLS